MDNNSPFIINIGRSLGAGGRYIGKKLAEHFDIRYFDKEILALAAKESGFTPEIFEKSDEHKGFLRSLINSIAPTMSGDFYSNQISDESLFRIQSDAIRKVAADSSCVFIGRCADYVLRDHPRCVNVFIAADEKDRIERIMKTSETDEKTARRMMTQGDAKRANYYNFYCSGKWGVAATYDLCINSSVLGLDDTFEVIKDFVIRKLQLDKD